MEEAEAKRRRKFEAEQFMKRITKDHPLHATLYCPHAVYIGHNGIFLDQCMEGCNAE